MRFRLDVRALLLTILILGFSAALITTTGCAAAKKHAQSHPNAVSTLDGMAYDDILVAQAALDQLKVEYAAGRFGKDNAFAAAAINGAGTVYNTARASWLAYRDVATGVRAGDSAALGAKLQADLLDLKAAIAGVQKLGGKQP